MKLGFGLYRHMLNTENFRFARQCGSTHLIAHLCDYFRDSRANASSDQPTGDLRGWGRAGDPDVLWTYDDFDRLKRAAAAEGLDLYAIENFDPAHWYDVLLGGPRRAAQLDGLKHMIRDMGRAGISVMGYNFSLAGVSARIRGPFARGQAEAVGMNGPEYTPIPRGMVWNMVYDPSAQDGTMPPCSSDELWERLSYFLEEILPVAEEHGVRLALHPDDPPLETVRGTPRLVWQPQLYQKLIELNPSPANALEYCVGTLAEMRDGDIYTATECYAGQNRIAYVHLRNVRGKVPCYSETFIDEGEVNVPRILRILYEQNFDGVIIPDHAPQMSCAAPWHAGMAFAMGYLKAELDRLDR
ncbi:MAG: mannonate dehydratase [Verrucomicrobiota bacterium JB024]|nr:mannonate dehydratase [Verrucomicrobiota bacterium JB024]